MINRVTARDCRRAAIKFCDGRVIAGEIAGRG